MTEINKEEATVNGVPVRDLSEAGQKFFDKLLVLKKEADELASQFQLQQAGSIALKTLSEQEVELAEGETLADFLNGKAGELDESAKQVFQQHEQKQAALKEISNMILEEVNEMKEAEPAE